MKQLVVGLLLCYGGAGWAKSVAVKPPPAPSEPVPELRKQLMNAEDEKAGEAAHKDVLSQFADLAGDQLLDRDADP